MHLKMSQSSGRGRGARRGKNKSKNQKSKVNSDRREPMNISPKPQRKSRHKHERSFSQVLRQNVHVPNTPIMQHQLNEKDLPSYKAVTTSNVSRWNRHDMCKVLEARKRNPSTYYILL
mmetsp:Transcript_57791/g.95879  ORF Transcript_57791/g.95879 Transcript_57791/m.95879 type:complete len:118 (-) Transcript_57791:184-537(-)